MDNMRDYMGAEHFPPCRCFEQDQELSNQLYSMAQDHADSFVSHMVTAGYCEDAMPYAIAMFTNMCVSMISSKITSQETPDVTPESLGKFSERSHTLLGKIKERQDALMRRADNITFAQQGGSSSVQ